MATLRNTLTLITLVTLAGTQACAQSGDNEARRVTLPQPGSEIDLPLQQALQQRRSIRSYATGPVTLEELSQLCWAAQGVTDRSSGYRAAPSAGATYPLELYAAVGEVEGLEAGLYRYDADEHVLQKVGSRDLRTDLHRAALRQQPVRDAPLVMVLTAVHERTARRYGERAERYVAMEAGHASQNIYLQATALGLGSVAIGAFDDGSLASVLRLPDNERPLYLMPVGRR